MPSQSEPPPTFRVRINTRASPTPSRRTPWEPPGHLVVLHKNGEKNARRQRRNALGARKAKSVMDRAHRQLEVFLVRTTEILISEVLIIWMLILSFASAATFAWPRRQGAHPHPHDGNLNDPGIAHQGRHPERRRLPAPPPGPDHSRFA